jgi:hypothetical protein
MGRLLMCIFLLVCVALQAIGGVGAIQEGYPFLGMLSFTIGLVDLVIFFVWALTPDNLYRSKHLP